MDRQTFKNAVAAAKTELKDTVAHKVALTHERTEYKLRTRGNTSESDRQSWFHSMDARRSEAKYKIRHLHLAYGYLRGQDYRRMETEGSSSCSWVDIYGIIKCITKTAEPSMDEYNKAINEIGAWVSGASSPFVRPIKLAVEEVAA